MVYKKHHPMAQIDTSHSSLDKKCPSLIAVLEKYKLLKYNLTTTGKHGEYTKGTDQLLPNKFTTFKGGNR